MITHRERFWLYAKAFRAAYQIAVQAGFTHEAIEDQAVYEIRKESKRLGLGKRLHWRTLRFLAHEAANHAMDKALPRRVFADYFANFEWFDTHSEAVRDFTGIHDR